jgi:hypothetical protein
MESQESLTDALHRTSLKRRLTPGLDSQESYADEEQSETVAQDAEQTDHIDEEQAQIETEFKQLYLDFQATSRPHKLVVIALVGKKLGGSIYAPQDCIFIGNMDDADQMKEIKEAVVQKAREWKAKNPDVINSFQLFEAQGSSSFAVTAIGGSSYGCGAMPDRTKVIQAQAVKLEKQKKAKLAASKKAKKVKKA